MVEGFYKGINALDEVFSIGGKELVPIVNKISHYFYENERIWQKRLLNSQSSKTLEGVFRKEMSGIFKGLLLSTNEISQIDFLISENLNLSNWENVFSITPKLIRLIRLLGISEDLILTIEDGRLHTRGKVTHSLKSRSLRLSCYQLTRELFNIETLLTYKLEEENDQVYISLDFNFEKSDDLYYGLTLNQNKEVLLLNHFFKKFVTSVEKLSNISSHRVVEIHDDGNITYNDRLFYKSTEQMNGREIIHFPFLFRPFSIIIPRGGKIISPLSSEILITGCDGVERKDEQSKSNRNIQAIDFYSLFQS